MTILYLDDWKKVPGAAPDYDTPNKSALRIAKILYDMGVKNWAFVLALHDQRLKGVDPHAPDLTDAMKAAVAIECKHNFWYYIREVARVPGSGGGDDVPFRFHRGNVSTMWLLLNHIMTFYLGPRQLAGKSLTIDMINSWPLNIASVNSTINLLTKDSVLRSTNLKRLKNIRLGLPDYLQLVDKADINNTEEISVKILGNRYVGHVPATSEKGALNKGRGMTAELNHIDELSFINYIGKSLPAMLAAGTAARTNAERAGAPYWTAITTTAGSITDRDGKVAYELVHNAAVWRESFYDAPDRKELENVVRANSRTGVAAVNCTFYHDMLGFTDADLEKAIEDSAMTDPIEIDKDFRVKWYIGSGDAVIEGDDLQVIQDSVIEPIWSFKDANIVVSVYVSKGEYQKYKEGAPIVVCLDPSEAISKDAMGLLAIDPYTGATIATTVCYNANIMTFSKWYYKNWVHGMPGSVSLIERRMGAAIIDQLLLYLEADNQNPFKRLFNWVSSGVDNAGKILPNNIWRLVASKRSSFGFSTSGGGATARSNLYGRVLRDAVKTRKHVVYDNTLSEQLSSLTIINGRVDHPSGLHDDLCIPFVLSHWLLTQSHNLRMYGIDPLKVLQYIPLDVSSVSAEEVDKRNKLKQTHRISDVYKSKLYSLIEILGKTKDPIMSDSIRQRIHALKLRLNIDDVEELSIAVLEERLKGKTF